MFVQEILRQHGSPMSPRLAHLPIKPNISLKSLSLAFFSVGFTVPGLCLMSGIGCYQTTSSQMLRSFSRNTGQGSLRIKIKASLSHKLRLNANGLSILYGSGFKAPANVKGLNDPMRVSLCSNDTSSTLYSSYTIFASLLLPFLGTTRSPKLNYFQVIRPAPQYASLKSNLLFPSTFIFLAKSSPLC
jgi:hypothetical protein